MNFAGFIEREKTIDVVNCGTEESLELICAEISRFLAESGIPAHKVVEICFGISGRVNVKTGESFSRYNSENIDEPLADWLSNRLGVRTIIENDTRTMALAELKAIKGKYKDFLFVNASWGIGMSIVIDGKIYHGMNGFSGELGHTNVYDNEIICHCGKKGCLETVASGKAICSQLKACIGLGKNSIMAERIEKGDAISEVDVVDAAINDDSLAIELIEKAGAEIGRQVANLINIFNPEAVIIGGSLTEVGEFFIQSIKLAVKKYCLRLLLKDVEVVQSVLRSKAGRFGTCLEAREDYIERVMFK
jgi:Transcriptional regulator/sugar kinase